VHDSQSFEPMKTVSIWNNVLILYEYNRIENITHVYTKKITYNEIDKLINTIKEDFKC
jgi:hypothetical protein